MASPIQSWNTGAASGIIKPRTTAVATDFVELLAKQDSESDTAEKTTMAMPRVELELSGGIRIKIY